jgi:transcription elongation factor SPT5
VLKGVPDKPELVLVKLREIKYKIYRRTSVKDRSNNTASTKDIVKVIEGACKVRPYTRPCTFSLCV